MSEPIESAAQSGDAIVYVDGEPVLPPRPPGRPRNNPGPELSEHDRKRELLRFQGIELTDEQFDEVWKKFVELRRFLLGFGMESQLSRYWQMHCSGCLNSDGQRYIANSKHEPNCDGINPELCLWPIDVRTIVRQKK